MRDSLQDEELCALSLLSVVFQEMGHFFPQPSPGTAPFLAREKLSPCFNAGNVSRAPPQLWPRAWHSGAARNALCTVNINQESQEAKPGVQSQCEQSHYSQIFAQADINAQPFFPKVAFQGASDCVFCSKNLLKWTPKCVDVSLHSLEVFPSV